jgi:hypothetical protein
MHFLHFSARGGSARASIQTEQNRIETEKENLEADLDDEFAIEFTDDSEIPNQSSEEEDENHCNCESHEFFTCEKQTNHSLRRTLLVTTNNQIFTSNVPTSKQLI